MKSRTNKNIIITGSSSGIGFATAVHLHNQGYNVFATCRHIKDVNKLKKLGMNSLLLDYTNENSISTAVRKIFKETNYQIYALFNNGAYALPGALEDIPSEALREILNTNLIGYHSLIRKILPIMRNQGFGKIIQCSSILGFICLPYRGAYNTSKWALEGFTDTLRLELEGTGIKVISVRPGPIKTKIKINSIPHFEKWVKWRESNYKEFYMEKLLPRLYNEDSKDRFELEATIVAKKILKIIKLKNPNYTYNITLPTHLAEILHRILPKKIFHKIIHRHYS